MIVNPTECYQHAYAYLTTISVTTMPTKTSYVYGDTLATAGMVVTATYSDAQTAAVTGFTCSPTSLTTVTNSQTITVSFTKGGIKKTTTFTVSVGKAAPTYTAPTKKTGLTYNTNAQALLNAGSTSHGTIYYSSDNSTWSTTIPTQTNANTSGYTAYWKLTGDANHTDIASTAITGITIAKADFTATVSISGYIYAGTKSTPTVSNNPGSGTVTYYGRATATGTATAWSSVTNKTYDAGTRYCYAVIAATSNYNACTTANASFTIEKADFTATVSISGYTYAGTKSTPSVSNNPGNGTVTYYGRSSSTGTATAWSSVTATTYNAGTRYVYATIAATTNYNSYTTPNKSFTIAKATGSSSISPTTIELNPDNPTATIAVTRSGNGAITATSSDTSVATTSVSGTTVTVSSVDSTSGTATITVSVAAGTNYTAPSDKTATVEAKFFSNPCLSGTVELGNVVTYDSTEWIVMHIDGNYAYLAQRYTYNATTAGVANTCNWGGTLAYSGSMPQRLAGMYEQNAMSSEALEYCQDVTIDGVTGKVFVPTRAMLMTDWDWPSVANSNRIFYRSDVPTMAGEYWTSTVVVASPVSYSSVSTIAGSGDESSRDYNVSTKCWLRFCVKVQFK